MPMVCPDCGSNLDAVPVGNPCPACGGRRRDATVPVETAGAIASVLPPLVVAATATVWADGHAVDAASPPVELPGGAWRRLEELATDGRRLTVLLHPPGEGGAVLCEVMDEDGTRLAAEVGTDAEDAVLNVADVIAGTRGDDAGGIPG